MTKSVKLYGIIIYNVITFIIINTAAALVIHYC